MEVFVGPHSWVFSVILWLEFGFLVEISIRPQLHILVTPEHSLAVIFRTLTVNVLYTSGTRLNLLL